ncbi:S41 family peptidase [Parabacteroides pacaensis]|uniref:S41 family peptidase n=1 Tax=Parabacteroides pacaensis TaxID=2086575 RepID=UPI000D0E57FE|nr:S41 family peptidase [Parabacteroides pacaensis]
MKHIIVYSIGWIFLLLAGSCEKGEEYTTSPRENFDALWKILDEHYCFFQYKDVDWNKVYDEYSIQIKDTMNQYQLFDLLGKMMAELKDGHTNLISSFDLARYWKWYEDYPDNYNESIQRNYLGTDYHIAGGIKYKILLPDSIGYMFYPSFSAGVGETNLDYILSSFKNCKGLIIDVRNNGGGSLTYSDRIASRFTKERVLAGYIVHKTGKGHNDFSEPYSFDLEPSDRIQWPRAAVVLTNRRCYSATNDFVNKMRILPDVTIMGDRTGGGSGLPFSSELPNGWGVRFSACPILNADKEITEFGIDPDIRVNMTEQDMEDGKDTIIEEAKKFLLKAAESTEK